MEFQVQLFELKLQEVQNGRGAEESAFGGVVGDAEKVAREGERRDVWERRRGAGGGAKEDQERVQQVRRRYSKWEENGAQGIVYPEAALRYSQITTLISGILLEGWFIMRSVR